MKSRIKELRTGAGLTQHAVAKAIGITQRKYSYLETQTQPLTDDILVQLARYYKTTADYILMLSEEAKPV